MDERLTHDPILKPFRAAPDEIYGARLAGVVPFGSRARDEARPDSDYDVAVFLKSLPDRWTELDRPADLRVRFIDAPSLPPANAGGKKGDATPRPAASYRDQTPLMHEIRRDGLDP